MSSEDIQIRRFYNKSLPIFAAAKAALNVCSDYGRMEDGKEAAKRVLSQMPLNYPLPEFCASLQTEINDCFQSRDISRIDDILSKISQLIPKHV